MPDFIHLHNHTQFSLLDGASDIELLLDKAKNDEQKGVAITDHGNMFGAFKFVKEARKRGLKPIVGCEFYVVDNRHVQKFERSKGEKDKRYHQLLIAKNQTGYQNLSKLTSLGYIEGMYGKYPRIDKELIEKYHDGLIATSCCVGGEIPQAILDGNMAEAEKRLQWWIDILGDDYYIEIQRHEGFEEIDNASMSPEELNQALISLAKKYNLKVIATNDSHYVNQEDWAAHDVLLCVNTAARLNEPDRFRFPSKDYYFMQKQEMQNLFHDMHHVLDNTLDIHDKVEDFDLARNVVLPKFPIPKGFSNQDEYLRYLTYEGAKKRYGELSDILTERINYELGAISKSGYPGYFLIVQDFINAGRKEGVTVGPGRGSAAGSVVAYALGITAIDPLKYNLLFERFLNPDRISMPDIDIDFDDEGRSKVIDYVRKKYGENHVAQIITYGTMKARMAIRDVGRVMDIPLGIVDGVAKTFPAHLNATLMAILDEKGIDEKLKGELSSEEQENAVKIRKMASGQDEIAEMLRTAYKLEGSVRNTGVHACGVVITPDEVSKYVPIATAKGVDTVITQFDNSVAESAGLLKMDFLGLKTLSIIKDTVELIKSTKKINIDIDNVDLEDKKTYELFQKGETIGIFQYESVGMQKHLIDLSPNIFEDLIAMNALYRPGPMKYIPDFIARKHGKQIITYDLPEMEEYLAETYGITVYQEQVMLLSQKLGNLTGGQADTLRKGMGKKNITLLDEIKPKFIEGCQKNGYPEKIVLKIWDDWEAFSSYAFNKSHSTCYAYIAFQTAYLKTHYPAEFMAAVLNHNKKDISKLNFQLRECKRMGIEVLGPDINESSIDFSVNKKGQIRFGLSALKGVGEGPVTELIEERSKNGYYSDIYDLVKRLDSSSVTKKSYEALILGGALDSTGHTNRAAFFAKSGKSDTFIEDLIKYGQTIKKHTSGIQQTLFGDISNVMVEKPPLPDIEPWSLMEKLEKEKEVTGIYVTGHPLEEFEYEIENFTTTELSALNMIKDHLVKVAGIVTSEHHGENKRGIPYGKFTIQDFDGTLEFTITNEVYHKFNTYLKKGQVVYIEGLNQRGFNSESYFFKVNDVRLLDTVGKVLTKSITFFIPAILLNQKLISDLSSLCKKNKGQHKLKVIFSEGENTISTVSKSITVNVTNDFVKKIKKLGIKYKIN
ncbi:MAG: DNA polymerase III subunit alpha [Deltaproteobacteria bacterium]